LLSEKLPRQHGDGGAQNGHVQVRGLSVFCIHSHGHVCILADHLLYGLVKLHITKYYLHLRLKIKRETILKYRLFVLNFTHPQNAIGSWLMGLQTDEQLSDANFTDKTKEIQLIRYAASYSKQA